VSTRLSAVAAITLLALACGSDRKGSSGAPASNGQATVPGQTAVPSQATMPRGRAVPPTEEGAWQVFDLPADWVARHLGRAGAAGAYVALAAAHPEDIRQRGSCAAPPRIVVGVVQASGSVREHTALCLHYCGAPESDGRPYRGLFGTHTHLQGITLQILDDGTLDVIEHFREVAFVAPEVYEDPRVVDKLRYNPDVRILHDTLRPSAFKFTGDRAQSCVALEEP
jgi:hypothetical protein